MTLMVEKRKVFVRKGLVVEGDDVEQVPLPPSVPEPEPEKPARKTTKAKKTGD